MIPGFFGLTNNKILAVGSFSLTIIIMINTLLYSLNYNDNYNEYTLFKLEPFLITSQISTLIIFLFYYLDNNLDRLYWNNVDTINFGSVRESEPPYPKMFILRKMNSHSSIFQFFVGLYALLESNKDEKLYYSSTLFGISHIFMGLISYIWWASNLCCIHKLDLLLMELTVNSLTVLVLSTTFPSLELIFIILCILYFKHRTTTLVREEIWELVTVLLISTLIPTLMYGNCGDQYIFMLGSFFTLGGLVPKIADIKNNFIYGTALFHFMEAFGFLMIYNWTKTFPINDSILET
tara:strand:+ start:4508 stop:5386 length:879 start_codon:yes stop_codon:yes gene_type:complete